MKPSVVQGNCVGALCFCDTRYDWTTYCDVGFWANKTVRCDSQQHNLTPIQEVCPGEPFTVQWDFAGNLSTGNPQDEVCHRVLSGLFLMELQFLVAYPLEASPFATWSVASFIQAQSSNEIMRHSSSFLYRMAGETGEARHPPAATTSTSRQSQLESVTVSSPCKLMMKEKSTAATGSCCGHKEKIFQSVGSLLGSVSDAQLAHEQPCSPSPSWPRAIHAASLRLWNRLVVDEDM